MSDFNIVVAHFGHHNRVVMTDTLYQYDYGQKLKVEGITALPQTFQAHFSNVQRGGVSITVTGINGMVDVPNSLLMTGKRIYCWIYVTETGSGETVYQILMPVQSRPMPEYYDVEDVGVFDSVVNQVAEYAATATTGATSATASATAAAGSATAAAASASAAEDSAENAAASETNAEAFASAAQASDASAATAATTATAKAAEAAQSATSAGSAADRAEAAQEAAETAQGAAETAATSAATDAATASTKATAAAASATTASTKATDATNAATTATAQAAVAEAAKTTAVEAKTAAQSAQSAAETEATTATAKATEAAASATAAAQAAASINTPDSALSESSTNAVQNKVVTAEFADVKSQLEVEHTDQEDFTDFALSNIRHVTDRTSELIQDHYLSTNAVGETLDPTNIVENTGTVKWAYTIFQVSKGDIIRYEGSQVKGLTTRCLVLTDDEYVIYYAGTNETFTNRIVQIQAKKDGYCVCNAVTVYSSGTKARYKIYHITEDTYSNVLDSLPKIDDSLSITKKIEVPCDVTLVANEYVNSSGAFVSYNNWSRTDYIDVSSGSLRIVNGTGTSSQYNFFYDSEHSPIGSKFSFSGGETVKSVPSNAKYAVLSAQTSVMQNVTVYTGDHYMDLADRLPLTETMREEVEEIAEENVPANMPMGLINPTAYIMKTLIPSYYFARNETPESFHDIGYIEDKINSIPDGYHFIFVTDTHWNDNAKQSIKLISYVRDRIGAKHVLFGGDILTAHNTKEKAYRWLYDFVSDFKSAFGSNLLLVVGNHDLNHAGSQSSDAWITYNELIPLFLQGNSNAFHYCDYSDRIDSLIGALSIDPDDVQGLKDYFKTIYYVDDDYGKTRYLVYNTGGGHTAINQYTGVDGSNEDLLILDWVYDVLMSTPEGYNFVACTHIPTGLYWNGETPGSTPIASSRQSFPSLIAAVMSKRNLTVAYPSIGSLSTWTGVSTKVFSFADAPDLGVVMIIGGHYHIDSAVIGGFTSTSTLERTNFSGVQTPFNATEYECYQSATVAENGHKAYEIPIIYTQHDAYLNNDVEHSYPKTLNTITEQSFDVVTITPDGNIALTRFGAGYDRTVTIY